MRARWIWRLVAIAGCAAAPAAIAQNAAFTPRADAAQIPSYDLVSIHKATDDTVQPGTHNQPDGFTATRTSLRSLISEAYGFSLGALGEQQVLGAPEWAKTQLFDLHAKVDPDHVDAMNTLAKADTMMVTVHEMASRTPSYRMLMLQRLLEDRFHLKVHYEQKEMALYEMTVAKGGVRLPLSHPKDPNSGSFSMSEGKLDRENVPISFISIALALITERPVQDRTGDKGVYDFKLRWTGLDTGAANADESAPSLFTAVQEQMGLKLKAGKGPVWMIVIDHAELPTEN